MGYDFVRTTDGRELQSSVVYVGPDDPVEITIGDSTVTLAEFLSKVDGYLTSPGTANDFRQKITSALSQATIELRERSHSYVFRIPRRLNDSGEKVAPPFDLHGQSIGASALYDFLWYVMQKMPIDSFLGDTRYLFLSRFAKNLTSPHPY